MITGGRPSLPGRRSPSHWTQAFCVDIVPSTIGSATLARSFRTIVRLTGFDRSAEQLLSEEDQASLDHLLAQRPAAGAIVRGTGGVRKLRVRSSGRGKRGGARVIYYYHGRKDRVYLILAYPKNAKDDLSGREKQRLRKLTTVLEGEP